MGEINLKKNILTSGSFRIIVIVATFLTSIMSARYLGVELKGKYGYLYALIGFALVLLDMGVYRSIPYMIRKFPQKLNLIFSLSIVLFIAETLILGSIGMLIMDYWSLILGFEFSTAYMLIFVFTITISKFNFQLQSFYVGLDRIWDHSIAGLINSLSVVVFLVLGFLVFRAGDKLLCMLLFMLGSKVLTMMFYLFKYKWPKLVFQWDSGLLKLIYTYSFRVFVSSLFITFLIRFDIILIKRALDFSQVGIYSIAAHIIDLLQLASNVVGGLLLVKLTDSATIEEKWHIMRKILVFFVIILGTANLGFILLGKVLLGVFFGIDFVPVYGVYLWLMPASFSLSFGSLFNNYLNSKGFPLISIILPAVALILNIVLNLLLIPIYGIIGAAIATSIAYTLWFVSIVIYEHYTTGRKLLSYLVPRKSDFTELMDYALSLIPIKKVRS